MGLPSRVQEQGSCGAAAQEVSTSQLRPQSINPINSIQSINQSIKSIKSALWAVRGECGCWFAAGHRLNGEAGLPPGCVLLPSATPAPPPPPPCLPPRPPCLQPPHLPRHRQHLAPALPGPQVRCAGRPWLPHCGRGTYSAVAPPSRPLSCTASAGTSALLQQGDEQPNGACVEQPTNSLPFVSSFLFFPPTLPFLICVHAGRRAAQRHLRQAAHRLRPCRGPDAAAARHRRPLAHRRGRPLVR